MKTLNLSFSTLICILLLMSSCHKQEMVSPMEVNNEPELPGDNYVPSQNPANEDSQVSSTVVLEEQKIINENPFGYFDVFPRRFDSKTKIEFEVVKSAYVSLMIFDSEGNMVLHPVGKLLQEGLHPVEFDASELPEGVYTIRLWARHKEYIEQVEKIKYSGTDK